MAPTTNLAVVVKPETVQQLGTVDICKLQTMTARIPEKSWNIADKQKENKFFCFQHTRHIIFRFIPRNQDPLSYYDAPVWLLWEPVLRPLFDKIVSPYQFKSPVYPKAMLARLAAGQKIDTHIDGAGSNLLTHKIHVPIQTNQDAVFFADQQPFHLSEGIAYEVNNIKPHGVENAGGSDRIHLIFEVFDGAQ